LISLELFQWVQDTFAGKKPKYANTTLLSLDCWPRAHERPSGISSPEWPWIPRESLNLVGREHVVVVVDYGTARYVFKSLERNFSFL